jgi:hypothetical protein
LKESSSYLIFIMTEAVDNVTKDGGITDKIEDAVTNAAQDALGGALGVDSAQVDALRGLMSTVAGLMSAPDYKKEGKEHTDLEQMATLYSNPITR